MYTISYYLGNDMRHAPIYVDGTDTRPITRLQTATQFARENAISMPNTLFYLCHAATGEVIQTFISNLPDYTLCVF